MRHILVDQARREQARKRGQNPIQVSLVSIQAAADYINQSNVDQACQQLQDVLHRIDGLPRPPEFAGGPAAPDPLAARIEPVRADPADRVTGHSNA
jgi:ECF sigma factor